MKPTYDNVFVTDVAKETVTASGIVLTGDVETGSKPGLVVAVGPDCNPDLQPGMEVYLKWNEATPVTYQGKQGALVSQTNILAVL